MRFTLLTFGLWIGMTICHSQNINYDFQNVYFYQYPLKPLDPLVKTCSVSLQELGGGGMVKGYRDSLQNALYILGLERKKEGGDVQVELVISPLYVRSKEVKDRPLETEKDGKKSVLHQYSYSMLYSLPMKVRLLSKGRTITEQDLSGTFTADYFPRNNTSLSALQQEYDNDTGFWDGRAAEKMEFRRTEIRKWLLSNYGRGFVAEGIAIGYVKDKKGEYPDLTKALSIMHEAFASANKRIDYLDDAFRAKASEALAIWNTALREASEEKKARIDPKVTAMIQANVSLAYFGLNDLDKASEVLEKIKKPGSETYSAIQSLKEMIADKRARSVADGLLKGERLSAKESGERSTEAAREEVVPVFRDYIVAANGDTVEARIVIPPGDVMDFGDSVWMEDRIVVANKNRNEEFYPNQIRAYSYKGIAHEALRWVQDMNRTPWTYEQKFCKRLATGAISVYQYYYVTSRMNDSRHKFVASRLYYRKGNQLQEMMFLNFNKSVSKLVSDYSELSERVRGGAYQREDFVKIIGEYNAWANRKSKD